MTTEQKAKAYDEALERAIELQENSNGMILKKWLWKVFPELAEPSDERIRKALLHLVNSNKELSFGIDNYDGVKWEDIITWLEKQGEQKSIWHNEYEEPQRDSLILLIMQSGTPIVAKIIEPNHTFSHGERWAYIDDLLEKQGEQKSVDKIEPKFHEGEWIISNDKKSTYQVIEVKRGIYVIRDNIDNHEYHIGIEECEKSGRLFTIQDAKDGDVLVASDSSIFIFKEVRGSSCKHYIALTSDNEIQVNTKLDKFWETARGVKPSTKEQRDTLLKAIANAGYTFDFEKKELKKIEKKSQRMVLAEAKEALYDKPDAWSEEDETNSCHLKTLFENLAKDIKHEFRIISDNDRDKYTAWLKSLKDRYTWKPSKGQLECLDVAIDKVDKDHSPFFTNRAYLTLKALKNNLNSYEDIGFSIKTQVVRHDRCRR